MCINKQNQNIQQKVHKSISEVTVTADKEQSFSKLPVTRSLVCLGVKEDTD